MELEFHRLPGLTPYQVAWDLQRAAHADVAAGRREPVVYLLEHEPVFTAGRRTEPHEYPFDGSEVIPVDRGGKITWHGPGQLVAYPIIALPDPIDVVAYLRRLEDAAITVCAAFGLRGYRVPSRSGVWLSNNPLVPDTSRGEVRGKDDDGVATSGNFTESKVCAVGARVAQSVTMHGMALNCDPDLTPFTQFIPCGITDAGVTSLSRAASRDITVANALPILQQALADSLSPLLGD